MQMGRIVDSDIRAESAWNPFSLLQGFEVGAIKRGKYRIQIFRII